jgi:hypothetical protein
VRKGTPLKQQAKEESRVDRAGRKEHERRSEIERSKKKTAEKEVSSVLEEVKAAMRQNLGSVLERGEKLDELESKSAELATSSLQFSRRAGAFTRQTARRSDPAETSDGVPDRPRGTRTKQTARMSTGGRLVAYIVSGGEDVDNN